MERILLVIDAHKPGLASINFACKIAGEAGAKLTGIFIENLYAKSPNDEEEDIYLTKVSNPKTVSDVVMDTEQAVKFFVQQSALQQLHVETFIDTGEPVQQVLAESRFADLLIVDPHLNFYDGEEQIPSHFTKEILAGAECPVLLSPDVAGDIDDVVFCYDGSASAVFAIKQFTYLMPGYAGKKAILLEVNKTSKVEFSEEHWRLMNWMQAHYSTVTYQSLNGKAKDELLTYFFMRTGTMVVMGAYGRSLLSNFFKHSVANGLIRTVDLPLFITHH